MTNREEFSNGVKEWFIRRRSHRREIEVGPAGNGEGFYRKSCRSVWIALTGEGLSCEGMKYTPQGKGEGSFEIGAWNWLRSHLKTPFCGRGWKVRLPKAEKILTRCWNEPDLHQSKVQHDNRVSVSFFCHPELVSGSRLLVLRIWVLEPRPCGRGSLLGIFNFGFGN